MSSTTWLAEVDTGNFRLFLENLWGELKLSQPELPNTPIEGIGEIPYKGFPIAYALDSKSNFAAYQWLRMPEDQSLSSLVRVEAFFVCPNKNSTAKVGLRLSVLYEDHTSVPHPDQWWIRVVGEDFHMTSQGTLPGFLELVSVLASNGDISTSSSDSIEAIAELEYELRHANNLIDDQHEELRQSRSRYRDLSLALKTTAPKVSELVHEQDALELAKIKDLSGLAAWSDANEDRIVIMPRALNNSKKSIYANPQDVYAALEFLAGPYRDARMSDLSKESYDEALQNSGFQIEGSVGKSVAGSHGDAYFVTWNKRRRFVDMHLTKGGGRDERYCLRVYYFWDQEIKKVVVGWLPSHLSNSLK